MALGILQILYIILIVIAVIVQALLYKSKDKTKNTIFIINMLFSIILSYVNYTSLPINFAIQRIVPVALMVVSIIAVAIKLKDEKFINISKAMLSISIVGNFLQILI